MTTSFDSTTTYIQSTSTQDSQPLAFSTTGQLPQSADIQPFPSPQTFTFLPQLYTLISRLAPLQSQSQSQGQPQSQGTSTPATSRASRSPTLTRRPATSAGSTADVQPAGADTSNGTAPLALTQTRSRDETIELKDLPALVYPLRQQIEKAKEVVKGLPDVERSVEQQQEEIRELEARIKAFKVRLGQLGTLAATVSANGAGSVRKEDVVMQGVEG